MASNPDSLVAFGFVRKVALFESSSKWVDVAVTSCSPSFMANKFTIAFFFCILGFIASEYFLLQELFSGKRLPIIVGTIVGIISSIILFLVLYRKLLKITG